MPFTRKRFFPRLTLLNGADIVKTSDFRISKPSSNIYKYTSRMFEKVFFILKFLLKLNGQISKILYDSINIVFLFMVRKFSILGARSTY